jgi:DNA-binding NtrC family response regulator
LIVDDQDGIRFAVRSFLESHEYEIDEAIDCASGERQFRATRPDAVLLDYSMPDGTALELLPRLREIDPNVPMAVLTAHGSIDLAVQAVKEGAEQFLTKPVELPALLVVVQRLVENRRNRQKQLVDRARAGRRTIDPFVGTSAAILQLAERARRVSHADSPVLIGGETGTGKGVLARWLHENGPRAEEAFVDLNCGGLSREFLETELFGHERGAFTGANASKTGLLEMADRGTVFLDEIGDVDMEVQPKLLKVLEEKRFRRLGSVRDRQVDIRLISATHHDLGVAAREKRFRSDLYFRIATIPLVVPPLRERAEDVPLLARDLLAGIKADLGRPAVELAPDAMTALQAYRWPGNIRELRNVLERALLLSDRTVIRREDLQFEAAPQRETADTDDLSLTLVELERRHLERILADERGHVGRAATRLGIPRSSLYQKIKRYEIALSRS